MNSNEEKLLLAQITQMQHHISTIHTILVIWFIFWVIGTFLMILGIMGSSI